MADDIDAGINLNISIPTKRPSNKSSNQRDRITGDRRQRIKARKSLKRLKEKNDDANLAENVQLKNLSKTETESGLETTSDKHDKQDYENKDSNHKEEGSKKKTGAVISSLFRHNPDIPTVTSKKVEQVKEKLFSSDSFQDAPLHPYMRSNLEKHGFAKMTSVQRETIPLLLNGQDVLVKSQTGSGKTLSYALPIIEDLSQQTPKLNRSDGARAIVIVPTRELAVQSYEVFEKLVKPFIWLIPGCVVGGNNRKAEKARLRKGVSVLVATPGRLMDHIENTNSLDVGKIKWLVLDEADRLLDLGFEKQIAKIIEVLDNKQTCKRQTVLLSATLSPGVERLAGMSLRDPQRVAVSNDNEAMTSSSTKTTKSLTDTNSNTQDSGTDGQTDPSTDKQENFALPQSLKQYFVITPCKLRLVVLLILILSKCKRELNKKMIVFLSTQDGVEFLYKLVSYLSTEHSSDSDVDGSDSEGEGERPVKTYIDVYRLHGEMSQKDRTTTFHKFCATKSGVLICTDVAARGLHLPFVQWVVQYTASSGVTDYIHRAGRTARAGTAGNSVLFLMPSEIGFIKQLNQKNISLEEWKLNEILQDVTKILPMLPGLEETQRQAPKTIEESATYLQNCCELYVKNGKDVDGLAKSAYQSYIRAYATYPTHMKPVFHVKYLHLGHVAKTFGLREAPSNIGNIAGVSVSKMQSKRKHEDDKFSHKPKKARFDPASEYKGSAMFTKKTTAKRNPNQRGKKHKTFRGKLIKKKKGK